MSPLAVYVAGYLLTVFAILIYYGHDCGRSGDDTSSEQLWTWFITIAACTLWPLIWSYYVPFTIGKLLYALRDKRRQ